MEFKTRENFITNAMNAGMARAAKSFSVLLGSPVSTNPPQILALDHHDNFTRTKENDKDLYVIVTQMIGDINGKSYLMFNDQEVNAIVNLVEKDSKSYDEKLREAFLMEIDNIVSAAVISELSDALKLEIYGDVPMLKRLPGSQLYPYIAADKDPRDSDLLIINTGFSIEKVSLVRPQFIWKFTPALLETIPASMIAVQNR